MRLGAWPARLAAWLPRLPLGRRAQNRPQRLRTTLAFGQRHDSRWASHVQDSQPAMLIDMLKDTAQHPPSTLGASGHIQGDLTALDPARIRGFDAILCCETLEHLPWESVGGVLRGFAGSGAPYLLISVPYEGAQIGWSFYANAHTLRHRLFTRWLRFFRRFRIASLTDIDAHKWEVGYKGHSLAALKEKVTASGWQPVAQHFTDGCRSVFLVCRNSVDRGPRTEQR